MPFFLVRKWALLAKLNNLTKDVAMVSQGDFNSLVLEQFPIHLLATLGSELLQAFEELPGRENNQFVRMML